MLGKELRGFEIFAGGEKTQEFVIEYSGSGLLYINVETTALRMLKSSIDAYENIKKWGSVALADKKINSSEENLFSKITREILTPASDEFNKEKETFLILLK